MLRYFQYNKHIRSMSKIKCFISYKHQEGIFRNVLCANLKRKKQIAIPAVLPLYSLQEIWSALKHLGRERSERLLALAQPISQHIVDQGGIPHVNPMGLSSSGS